MTQLIEQKIWGYWVLATLLISGIDPSADRLTWVMETIPVMIALPLLWGTYDRFPLTILSYRLLALWAFVLMYGGFYTYAETPLFNEIQQVFDLDRNHYDRVAHFIQGVVPAILAREILLRTSPLQQGKWLFFIVSAICLAISACYEFIEWWAALLNAQAAESFLGTQGDQWDTQWDMFLALLGSIFSQLVFAQTHNKQLATLSHKVNNG